MTRSVALRQLLGISAKKAVGICEVRDGVIFEVAEEIALALGTRMRRRHVKAARRAVALVEMRCSGRSDTVLDFYGARCGCDCAVPGEEHDCNV